jgi:hypothetical protein
MKNSIIQYGLIGGIVVSVLFLGPIVIDANSYMDPEKMRSGEIIGYSIMVLSMLSVYFGIRAYRKNYNKAEFSFLKGLAVGLQITVLANVIFYAANVLLYEVISPNFLAEFGTNYKQYIIDSVPDEASKLKVAREFESQASVLENSYLYALVMASSTFFIGIIISLISALVLKRSK